MITLRKKSKQHGRHLGPRSSREDGSGKCHSNDSGIHKTRCFPCIGHSVNIPPQKLERIKNGRSWMWLTHTGPLILTGVYRSQVDAASSLWNGDTGRAIFCATALLELFQTISAVLRSNHCETRPRRHVTDKLAAIGDVWDNRVERLPLMYNPYPEVTVEERLVPFKSNNCLLDQLIHDLCKNMLLVVRSNGQTYTKTLA